MDLIIYAIIGLAALLFFGAGILRTSTADSAKTKGQAKAEPKRDEKLPYVRCPGLLTPNEHAFFKVLLPMVEGQYHVFAKVRIEDIIQVPTEVEYRERQKLRGRIKSRHIDFVICDRTTLEVLTCIELDDKSHRRAKSKEADEYNDRAMRDAGVPLIRVPARMGYSEEYLKSYLFEEDAPANETDPTQAEALTPPQNVTCG